jgi:hypothetical protein
MLTKLVYRLAISFFLSALCMNASAGGPSGTRVPSYVEVLTDGSVIIEAGSSWNNPDNCLNAKRIVIPAYNVHIDRYYAAVLTGFAGRDSIWAWLEGCRTMPWGAEYPIVKNVAILPAP